jgi:hypothetical protein
MKTRGRFAVGGAVVGWVALGVVAAGAPARADSISVGAISEGTEEISTSNPEFPGFTPGPFPPPLSFLESQSAPTLVTNSALKFDISSIATIPQGATISSAVLSLKVANSLSRNGPTSLPAQDVSGYADNAGVVTLADFSKPASLVGAITGLPFASGPPGSLDLNFTFDVTGFIQSLVNARSDFVGFVLTDATAGGGTVDDWSAESTDPTRRPNLTITFSAGGVPEPPGALLLGLGLAGLLVLGRVAAGRQSGGVPG